MTCDFITLFNLFLAAATVFIIAAAVALILLVKDRKRGHREDEARPTSRMDALERTTCIAGKTGAHVDTIEASARDEATSTTEQQVDGFSYEQSGFYKWFNAQRQSSRDEEQKG